MLMDSSGGALPFKGAVSLNRWVFGPFWGVEYLSQIFFNSPDVTLYYLEFWGLDQNKVPEHPEQILLGRKVCSSLENLY